MAAGKPRKSEERRVMTLELSWAGVALLVVILVVTYGGMFLMGFFAGKGLSPASIDADTLAKRLVGYLGKPAVRDAAPKKKAEESSSVRKSLDFYDTLEGGKTPLRPKAAPEIRAPEPPRPTEEAAYMIQVSSLKSEERAAGLAKELDSRGFPAKVVEVMLEGRGTLFRVVLEGEFTLAKAKSTAKRLEEEAGHRPLLLKTR